MVNNMSFMSETFESIVLNTFNKSLNLLSLQEIQVDDILKTLLLEVNKTGKKVRNPFYVYELFILYIL